MYNKNGTTDKTIGNTLVSGNIDAPAKGVGWDNCREGSNPSFSAKTLENTTFSRVFCYNRLYVKMAGNGE